MELSKIELIGDKDAPHIAHLFIDGNEIHGVTRVSFEHSAGDVPEVQIDIAGIEIDMQAFEAIISSERAKVLISLQIKSQG